MIIRCRFSSIILFVILILSICFLGLNTAIAQTNQADSKLQAATNSVNQAFNAVLDAEKAGANVTDLLSQLNNADNLLAEAENSYRAGDTNATIAKANSVLPITQEVTNNAQVLKQSATVNAQNSFWLTIVSSVVVAVVFILVLFFIWRWFKKNYMKRLSEAKPEVTDQ
jgi:preprotein translocase subunit SecF